ncbi:MAG: hypothetical protein WBC04_24215 [Candidatus Acidiferrales bacterium]
MRAHQSDALSTVRRNAFKVSTIMPLLAVAFFPWLLSVPAAAPAAESAVDFPLAFKTKWTDHLHEETGEGVHFGPLMAKFAKGNSVDVPVITEVVGSDFINGGKYIRLEARMGGILWLTEWLRQTPSGLLLGKTIDAEQGQEVLMVPPQKLLSPTLKAGESWDWKAPDAPVVMQIKVVGPADLTVPAGTFHTTELSYDATIETEGGMVTIRQTRWFAPGVGYVKQDTETRLGDRMLTHVVLTLEKYEPARGAQPAGG